MKSPEKTGSVARTVMNQNENPTIVHGPGSAYKPAGIRIARPRGGPAGWDAGTRSFAKMKKGGAPSGAPPFPGSRRGLLLPGQGRAQVVVVGTFGHTEPGHDVVAEGHVVVEDLLESGILVAEFLVDLVGGLERRVHDFAREALEHGAPSDQTAQGFGVVGVVVLDHLRARGARGDVDDTLVGLGQFGIGLVVDVQ